MNLQPGWRNLSYLTIFRQKTIIISTYVLYTLRANAISTVSDKREFNVVYCELTLLFHASADEKCISVHFNAFLVPKFLEHKLHSVYFAHYNVLDSMELIFYLNSRAQFFNLRAWFHVEILLCFFSKPFPHTQNVSAHSDLLLPFKTVFVWNVCSQISAAHASIFFVEWTQMTLSKCTSQ